MIHGMKAFEPRRVRGGALDGKLVEVEPFAKHVTVVNPLADMGSVFELYDVTPDEMVRDTSLRYGTGPRSLSRVSCGSMVPLWHL